MKNEFKYEIWDLTKYIIKLGSKLNNLTEYDLEKISGGIVNRKFAANSLVGLSFFMGLTNCANITASANMPAYISQSKVENQSVNFEITKKQALEDINYVLKVIKDNHASSVEKIPDEVIKQSKIEIENLKGNVTIVEEWRIISRILSKLHDAHTRVLSPEFLNKRLPFDTKYDCGKIICETGNYKNCEIIAINDISIQELYKNFQNHFSYEIEEWTEHNFFETPSDFIPEWKLALCGIDTSKTVKVSFRISSEIKDDYFDMSEIKTLNANSEYWMSYKIDEKNNLGIFKLNLCQFNDEYMQTFLKFLKEISEKKIKNIAIDLRKNVGGDSQVVQAFALALKRLSGLKAIEYDIRDGNSLLKGSCYLNKNYVDRCRIECLGKNYNRNILFDGNLFLLTSHQTFSSGLLFAEIFQDNDLGTIVGEVPGNSPEHFGNLTSVDFKTPHSQLNFKTTFKKFYRIDKSKSRVKLIPDIQTPAKNALNKVYEIIGKQV